MPAAPRRAAPRLPRLGQFQFLQGFLGDLVLRPWFDWMALKAVARGYLPLSRGWAAAQAAGGDAERFLAEHQGGAPPRALLAPALQAVAGRRAAYDTAARDWEALFFGAGDPDLAALVAAEVRRHKAAHGLMATRAAFVPLLRYLPPVRWQVARPEEVEALHGRRLDGPEAAFPAPGEVPLEASRPVPGAHGMEHWLRFPSPVLGDRAWARVLTPEDVGDPPTLISLHGIMMENEMWRGAADPVSAGGITGGSRGLRIVWPEGPWHGRRRLEGWYGGEPIIGQGPLGLLELFQAWLAEVAVLIRWARETSRGPVALGGVSLGALTSQLAAVAAHRWPAACRPDALYLVATSGALLALTHDSSLATELRLRPEIEAAGWSRDGLARWLPLIEPRGEPALDPARIVMVIGESDDVAQFEGGLALARTWGLPEANLFARPQGHFSVSLGLLRDPAPLRRLAAVLAGLV
jgi:hypothetical protein